MERKYFLKSLGVGTVFALTFPCLQGCSKDDGGKDTDENPNPTGVDFTIDLNSSESVKLKDNGGFILKKKVVVAKNLEGKFVAASQICAHQQTEEVRFTSNDGGVFHCSSHGARFNQEGKPLNSVTANTLKIYKTQLTGTTLRIFE
ncbi:MAG: Rieske (2Fe-2S) protein [Cellulophaga sp.]